MVLRLASRREKKTTGAKTPLADATLNNVMLNDTAASGSVGILASWTRQTRQATASHQCSCSRRIVARAITGEQLKRCRADRERAAAVPTLSGTKYLFDISSIRPHALTGPGLQPSLAAAKSWPRSCRFCGAATEVVRNSDFRTVVHISDVANVDILQTREYSVALPPRIIPKILLRLLVLNIRLRGAHRGASVVGGKDALLSHGNVYNPDPVSPGHGVVALASWRSWT